MDPILPPYKSKRQIREELREFIERASKPRICPKPPRVDRGPIGGPASDRLAVLSTPLERFLYKNPMKDIYSEAYKAKHPVRPGALTYVITARVAEIAEPKIPYVKPTIKPLVRKSALVYEATPRIIEMAQPMKPIKKWKKKRPRYVKKGALKYKATKRILALAVPNPRQNPPFNIIGVVNPAALTAGCSRRIRILARPRKIHTEVLEHPVKAKFRKNQPEDEEED